MMAAQKFLSDDIHRYVLDGNLTFIGNASLLDFANDTARTATDTPMDPRLELLRQQLHMTRIVVQRIVLPVVVIFGVVGNSLNIAVLTRRWMKSSTNFYLTALAIFDVSYLVLALTMGLHHHSMTIKSNIWYMRYRKPIGQPLTDICSNTAVWLTLTFTVERYIGVCHPMKGKAWCTPERAKYIIAAVCFSAALVTFPEFFSYSVQEVMGDGNQTVLKSVPTTFGKTASYQLGYMYLNQAIFTILPLLFLLIFNTLLIRAVMQAAQQRKSMVKVPVIQNDRKERQRQEQQKITVMLITVVIVFLICQLPQAILNLYQSYLTGSGFLSKGGVEVDMEKIRVTIAANVVNLLVMINASVNFILYSSFSTKFRRTFRRLFCKCVKHKDGHDIIFSENVPLHSSSPSYERPREGSVVSYGRPAGMETTIVHPYGGTGKMTPFRSKNGYLAVQNDYRPHKLGSPV